MGASIMEQIKIQAQVLAPLLKAFQDELGEERTTEIARKAFQDYGRNFGQKLRLQLKGNSIEKIVAFFSICAAGDALDVDILKQTADAFEANVTGCRYAEFF